MIKKHPMLKKEAFSLLFFNSHKSFSMLLQNNVNLIILSNENYGNGREIDIKLSVKLYNYV